MTAESTGQRPGSSYVPVVVTYVCVLLVGACLVWAYLSMRAVMGVGGSCASGGPYQVATPCPEGSWLIAVAIPVLVVATLSGSGFASTIGGPSLLLPMWALLFTSLGWNFLEFAFEDGFHFSWLFCGVLFWAMAAPAWWAMATALRRTARARPPAQRRGRDRGTLWSSASLSGSLWWWGLYLALGTAGAFLGVAVYALASA
ncbi:hypothetical protein [Nocardioides sp. TF02-7]|uniref:hypothetical protein n=1 Tax=Nocardioides sp. TF02-7 TaxID=2917724 RepID=UPI001F057CDB|nr:hypothetical protein [Nocardioides sp. TF02-7]UMG91475.1 hypothetical protein MF408_15245 [Nocardioides sp. TF02-7]